MPDRDPRELFAAEKSLRARSFARKHRGRGAVPWIAAVALVASLAMAASVPHMIAGSPLRGQLAAAGSAVGARVSYRTSYAGCSRSDARVLTSPSRATTRRLNKMRSHSPFPALRFLQLLRSRQVRLAQAHSRQPSIRPLPSGPRRRSRAANPLHMRPRGTKSSVRPPMRSMRSSFRWK